MKSVSVIMMPDYYLNMMLLASPVNCSWCQFQQETNLSATSDNLVVPYAIIATLLCVIQAHCNTIYFIKVAQ